MKHRGPHFVCANSSPTCVRYLGSGDGSSVPVHLMHFPDT